MFNRLVSLQPSGLIVDSGKLDLLFTLPMESETFGISAGSMETEIIPPVLLLEPSMRAYNESLPSILARTYSDANFLQNISKTARTAENQTHLVSKTSAIHLEDDSFDFSSFLENTAYVQISDPGMPGPDFDIPRSKLLRARPKRAEQRKVWEAVYERYRDQRMEVCGLDLEPETTSIPASSMDAQQENQQENPHEADHEQAILMPTEHD